MTAITTSDVNAYIKHRQDQGAAAASINRELAILKRAYTLAIQAAKLLPAHRPHIPMLREQNVRTGFFEADQFAAVLAKLRAPLRPVAEFAYLAGWRVRSEVLPLEWRNVDLDAGTVSLDPGSTKNGEGRTIYLTTALRTLLTAQKAETDALKQEDSSWRACSIGMASRSRTSTRRGARRARRPACRGGSCMTCGGRRSGIGSGLAFRSASRCR